MKKAILSTLLCVVSAAALAGGVRPATPHAWSNDEIAHEAAFRNATVTCTSGAYVEQALGVSKAYVAHATLAGDSARVESAIAAQVVDASKLSASYKTAQCKKWTDIAFALAQPSDSKGQPAAPATAASGAVAARG
ncbi:hypothetical protein [Paraburkholderia youngii]|uniref:hypothetical protein n=1 Tax=Paraburkholderia youngii TaxID=2782701 RepID=UPI003D1CADC6